MTLLVDGPASIVLISGKVEIFGFQLRDRRKIIVRQGKRLPFMAVETSIFEIAVGKEAAVTEFYGDTIPETWKTAYLTVIKTQKKPLTLMVIGGVDSGKSSFCTYLANLLVRQKSKVALLDEDLGQSDIGPPCTIAYTVVTGQFTDMFNLKPERVHFVGVTSPSEAPEKTVHAASILKSEIQNKAEFLIINTDGWTSGEDAMKFKTRLASVLEPDLIFSLQRESDPSYLIVSLKESFSKIRIEQVNAAALVRVRSREKRQTMRELGFAKYLENSKMQVLQLSNIIIEENGKNRLTFPKQSENLLVGLHNARRDFLGIGVIRGVDSIRNTVKIQTAINDKPALVILGKVRLDEYLREIPREINS